MYRILIRITYLQIYISIGSPQCIKLKDCRLLNGDIFLKGHSQTVCGDIRNDDVT